MKTMKIKMKNPKNRKSKISYLTVQWLKLTFSEFLKKFINKLNKNIRFSKKSVTDRQTYIQTKRFIEELRS